VLFAPESVQTAKFNVGGYSVDTELVCKPEARSVRLAFWDLTKATNAQALATFEERAASWLEQLRGLDFTPVTVGEFDPEAELAQLAELTKSEEVRKRLGTKAEDYGKRIEAVVSPTGTPGILAQERILNLASEYRSFLWELKLAALIFD